MTRLVKLAALALLATCIGCSGALQAFDTHVTPSHDIRWASTGAVVDAGLQLVKVPFVWRVAADVTAASVVRISPWFGKNLDSGFMLMVGSVSTEILGCWYRGLIRRQHRCV